MCLFRLPGLLAMVCMSDTGGSSSGGSSSTPFSATLTLSINAFANPPVYQAGYVPLPIVSGADGDAPVLVAPPGVNGLPVYNVVANTGPSATATPPVPYAAVFDSNGAAPGSYAFTVQSDQAVDGTITVIVEDTPAQVVGAGTPVVLPLGQPVPTTLSY